MGYGLACSSEGTEFSRKLRTDSMGIRIDGENVWIQILKNERGFFF